MNEHENINSGSLDEKNVEQLTDELSELIASATDGQDGVGEIDAYLSALDEKSPLPFEIDAEASFDRFMDKHATISNQPATEQKPKRSIRRLIASAAIAAVLVCTTVVATQSNKNIYDIFARWTGKTFTVGKDAPVAFIKENALADGEEKPFDSLQEAVDFFGIDAPVAPNFIPDRFALEQITAKNKAGIVIISAYYSNGDDSLSITYRQAAGEDFTVVEQESNDVLLLDCGGINHYLFTVGEREKAYWLNGELECIITGNVSRDECKKIVESIYE